MRLTELAVSMAVFLIVCTGIAAVYSSFTKNSGNALSAGHDTVIVLRTDAMMRRYISSVCIPYWENAGKYYDTVRDGILNMDGLDESVTVCSVSLLYDADGFVRGLKVEWRTGGVNLVTEELFASVPVAGRRS